MLVDQALYVDGVRQSDMGRSSSRGFTWIGLHDATREEIAQYQDLLDLEDLAVDDAVSSRQRPKLDQFTDHGLLVFRTIEFSRDDLAPSVGEVFIFFGETFVLTVRRGSAMPLSGIRQSLESDASRLAKGPTAVVHELVDRLVDRYLAVAQRIVDDVGVIEDSVFDDDIPAKSHDMYRVKREIIELRRAVQPLLEPLTSLASGNVRHIDSSFKFNFSDVRDHFLKVTDEIDAMERVMDAALQANLALMAVKQNEDMRKISAWVGIAAVPTMIAGIYGMNFENMPELTTRFGYFVIVSVMGVVCVTLFRAFRRNKWL